MKKNFIVDIFCDKLKTTSSRTCPEIGKTIFNFRYEFYIFMKQKFPSKKSYLKTAGNKTSEFGKKNIL